MPASQAAWASLAGTLDEVGFATLDDGVPGIRDLLRKLLILGKPRKVSCDGLSHVLTLIEADPGHLLYSKVGLQCFNVLV